MITTYDQIDDLISDENSFIDPKTWMMALGFDQLIFTARYDL